MLMHNCKIMLQRDNAKSDMRRQDRGLRAANLLRGPRHLPLEVPQRGAQMVRETRHARPNIWLDQAEQQARRRSERSHYLQAVQYLIDAILQRAHSIDFGLDFAYIRRF